LLHVVQRFLRLLSEDQNAITLINVDLTKLSFELVYNMKKEKAFCNVVLLSLLVLAIVSPLGSLPIAVGDNNIFVMAYPSDIGEMNPLFSRSERTGWFLIQIYDSLIAYDTQMNPIPWLATSWEVSPDAKNFTFHIRQGVKWHDGVPLNASDVQFTLEYIKAAPEDALRWTLLQKMDSCTVHDAYTVSAVFSESLGFGLMQIGEINIVPKHIRDWGDWQHGNSQHDETWDDPENVTAHTGSGPFKFVERVPDEYILLEKNTDWWGKQPNIDGIRIEVISGESARILAMRQGTADTERYELTGAADIQAVQAAPELKVITGVVSQWDYVLGFNLTTHGLDDPIMRRAICYALDRQEIIDVSRGGYGTATWTTIPEAFFPAYYNATGKFPAQNITYANELLDGAGYIDTDDDGIRNFPSGGNVVLDLQVLSWDTISVDAGTAIHDELAEIGISVTVSITDDAVMYPNLYAIPRNYRMYEMSHGFAGYPDHVWYRMHSINDRDWGDNCYGLHNATMDAALDDLIHAINITAQKTAATKVQKVSVELTPYIPLFLSDDTHAIRKEWVNYTFVPGGIFTSMNRLTMINIYEATPEILPPTIIVLSPANATYDTRNVSLIFTVDKATSWIGYRLDGAANVTITGNTTITNIPYGSHKVVVYANDTYGNMGTSNTVYFVIVSVPAPPVVIILSPANTTYTSTSVDLRLSISEATIWIRYSLDGASNVTMTGTSATLSSLSIGSHRVRAYANDTTGLIGASSTIFFTIKEAPGPGIDWTLIIVVAVIFVVVGAAAVYFFTRKK
jgi:peptide/nickel transport system substrate-binding protein